MKAPLECRTHPTGDACSVRQLVLVAAEVVHGGVVEATPNARERGARHVDLGTIGSFIGPEGSADGAVDDVHPGLPRDDTHAAGTDARIADVEIAALLR